MRNLELVDPSKIIHQCAGWLVQDSELEFPLQDLAFDTLFLEPYVCGCMCKKGIIL